MKLLAISEHYYPRVGGTVNYVHETLCALTDLGLEVELIVPGPAPDGWLPVGMQPPPYTVRWVNCGYPPNGDPSRVARYEFCRMVNKLALDRANQADSPDVLHVMFGLFIMEVLETKALRTRGLPCFATVHNVPPMECRQTAPNASLLARTKEFLRLKAVELKNRRRLKSNQYDQLIVPSKQVKGFIEPIVKDPVSVIGHGPTSDLQVQMLPPFTRRPRDTLRLLTVGGYAPHKRQHVIPETATLLKKKGINFIWEVVGPSGRVARYFDNIQADICSRGLKDCVLLRDSVPFRDLGSIYDQANLYVQPSIEEGFCLTALDAAAAGLPVIGCNAGALPDIISVSGGELACSDPTALSAAIANFVVDNRWRDPKIQGDKVKASFSWEKSARELTSLYNRMRA